ncbi:uncharacterized protein [Pyxicephalus adspersus]|uniref:uncharacterized protein n=1 Tax=Pyxicephalus adspersus TaxID=30357 RepID=UPI003B5BAC7B
MKAYEIPSIREANIRRLCHRISNMRSARSGDEGKRQEGRLKMGTRTVRDRNMGRTSAIEASVGLKADVIPTRMHGSSFIPSTQKGSQDCQVFSIESNTKEFEFPSLSARTDAYTNVTGKPWRTSVQLQRIEKSGRLEDLQGRAGRQGTPMGQDAPSSSVRVFCEDGPTSCCRDSSATALCTLSSTVSTLGLLLSWEMPLTLLSSP